LFEKENVSWSEEWLGGWDKVGSISRASFWVNIFSASKLIPFKELPLNAAIWLKKGAIFVISSSLIIIQRQNKIIVSYLKTIAKNSKLEGKIRIIATDRSFLCPIYIKTGRCG